MSDEDIDERRSNDTLLEWIKGLGLPAASILVSGAIFVFQSQQQAFERQLSNVEDGYRFYFEHRTALERHIDADQEETLLKLISNTFPNVFCNVRADLHARVASAEEQDTPNGFGEDDRTLLLAMISSRDAPERAPLSSSFEWPWQKAPSAEKCPPLDVLSRTAAAGAAADGAAATAPITQEPAPAADQKKAAEKAEAPPAAEAEVALGGADKAAPSAVLADAAEGLRVKARAFAQTNDPRLFRVFFHVHSDGVRAPVIFDPLRAPLATNGFRAMRGVELVAAMPKDPQVRYFGPDEAARAGELAAMLNEYFASEKLNFKIVAIGDQFPNMPRTTLEVWVPNSANVAQASGLGLKAQTKLNAEVLDRGPLTKTLESAKAKPAIKPGL